MRSRFVIVGLALGAASLLPLASGGDDDGGSDDAATTTAAQAPSTSDPTIVISGFAFKVNAASTGTITVRNDDTADHTVTADDGSFSVNVPAGETATFDVGTAGSFEFHCNFHPTMKGTLVVT
jgi:plastocyanin